MSAISANWWQLSETVICGVQQGLILGPLLFHIIITMIIFSVVHCQIILYADDSAPQSYIINLSPIG